MRKLLKTILILSITFIGISLFFWFYLISDGFRDYQKFCSQYIVPIDNYYYLHNKYPSNLQEFKTSILDTRYNPKECGYYIKNMHYGFIVPNGFGIAGYSSIDKKWWYD